MDKKAILDPGADGEEWFAPWLPKTDAETTFEQVRDELRAVTGHLLDPSAFGVNASIPHLEAAVIAFSRFLKISELPRIQPALSNLRAELALASQLFENAYSLQSGWAAQLGLNLDGTAKRLLYSRPGLPDLTPVGITAGDRRPAWEG